MADLTGKVAIVTGSAQGVGGGIARQMARAGAKVLVADIDLTTAQNNVDAIVKSGGTASAMRVDVTRYEDLKSMIVKSQSLWGKLDFLVNNAFNASDAQQGGVLDVDEDRWESDIHALVTTVYAGCKYAIPVMAEGYRYLVESLDNIDVKQVDCLLFPGGYSPDSLRLNKDVLALTRECYSSGKIIAAICHGPWVLISAGLVKGIKTCGYDAVHDDLINAGAELLDVPTVRDGNIITGRVPDDLPEFCEEIVRALSV